ncbi:hypothetical protein VitviT2T_026807 [Vitis vinifera]|uniref:LanC-like protein GCL1 n=1 Tax=Vitis vinifera TaxID=29760 RepID=A0ABY9DNB3_VITVI|nr:hypothetical protein VitviT2T_026807 [Vitis vinifera]
MGIWKPLIEERLWQLEEECFSESVREILEERLVTEGKEKIRTERGRACLWLEGQDREDSRVLLRRGEKKTEGEFFSFWVIRLVTEGVRTESNRLATALMLPDCCTKEALEHAVDEGPALKVLRGSWQREEAPETHRDASRKLSSGEKYWGAAHGLVGIMHFLMYMGLKIDEIEDAKDTLRYMIKNRFPSGNYPASEEDRNRDVLVH